MLEVPYWSVPKPFTTYFPRANIHELLSPDLLHQLIKGSFKDHLVDWVIQYVNKANSNAESSRILADIDRRWVPLHRLSFQNLLIHELPFLDWLRSGSGAVRPFFGEPEPEPEVRFGNFANLNLGFTSKKGNFEFPADFPSQIFDFLRF